MFQLVPNAPPFSPCKCCSQPAPLFGVVDFYQTCAFQRPIPELGWSGIPIYYHRCRSCGFLFTTAFDHFTHEDFGRWIYNDQYIFADPEYIESRPKRNAEYFIDLFHEHRNSMRVLDYGCGMGTFAKLIREAGFPKVEAYDPFVPEFSRRPEGTFDIVIAFEVVEHTPDPRGTMLDMSKFMAPGGLIMFTTQAQPDDFASQGLNWYYVAPRNGHISIHTRRSLSLLSANMGMAHASKDEINTYFREEPPEFAKKLYHADIRWPSDASKLPAVVGGI